MLMSLQNVDSLTFFTDKQKEQEEKILPQLRHTINKIPGPDFREKVKKVGSKIIVSVIIIIMFQLL
jgi:hypothetical protein